MSRAGGIAAVVLAAGKSSRMGATKALLPLGAVPAAERVVGALSRAEVGEIVVVTGHDSEAVAPVLERLAVRRAHNAGYEAGMFSSVRTGVRALRDDVEAFFLLPVDYPLITAEVLRRLIAALQLGGDPRRGGPRRGAGPQRGVGPQRGGGAGPGGPGILHPTCCGLRGHPPLISGRYRELLLQAGDEDDLRSFLGRHAGDEGEIEVEDLTILADMDTKDDYRRMQRFATLLDAAAGARGSAAGAALGRAGSPADLPAGAPTGRHPSLLVEDALYLLALLEAPREVVRHCRAVAAVGLALAEALEPRMPGLDVDLVRCACLLHDMARTRPKHAAVAQDLLTHLGLVRLGEVVGAHMVMPAERLETPFITEEELVYLADKWVLEDHAVGLEEREAQALRRPGQDSEARAGVRARMQTARDIRHKVESTLGRPVEEVLRLERQSSI